MKTVSTIPTGIIALLLMSLNYSVLGQETLTDNETRIHITTMGAIDDHIFAGTERNGVYRSVDSGIKWVPVNNGLPNSAEILQMAVSGKNIFVVAHNQSYPAMFKSSDNGESWKESRPVPEIYSTYGVRSFKNKLFAATDHGLYESKDDGGNWAKVAIIPEKYLDGMVANKERIVTWSKVLPYDNVFYTSVDGIKWTILEDKTVPLDKLEVHGNNIVARRCISSVNYYDGRRKCMANELRILDRKGKKWELVEVAPRVIVFDRDNIYAIYANVTESKKKEVGYKREILMSDDGGKRWKKVDEQTDPFVNSDYEMQEELTKLKVWEPVEIAERVALIKAEKLKAEAIAAAKEKEKKERKALEAKWEAEASRYQGSGYSYKNIQNPNAPDYRALSNDRFNAMHNTRSYIDSRGGIHIR